MVVCVVAGPQPSLVTLRRSLLIQNANPREWTETNHTGKTKQTQEEAKPKQKKGGKPTTPNRTGGSGAGKTNNGRKGARGEKRQAAASKKGKRGRPGRQQCGRQPQPSKPTWVSVQDVVLNKLRPSTQPSQPLPELSHFYQTHKHKANVLLMSLWFLLCVSRLDTK